MDLTPLVWIDVETTGLDPARDVLLEIAVVVTDAQLNVLGEPYSAVIGLDHRRQVPLAHMDEVVVSMHTRSGLIGEVARGGILQVVENEALAYVRQHVPQERRAPLAGSSVGFDRSFLAVHMPRLAGHLHYRNVDVSTVRELAQRWYPDEDRALPRGEVAHRALPDILASIAELEYWRDAVFY